MTDFETKLGEIRQTFETIVIGANSKSDYIDARDHFDAEIKTLFADTVLKAIGEYQKLSPSLPLLNDTISAQNALRAEIKAKIFEEVGVKEKKVIY